MNQFSEICYPYSKKVLFNWYFVECVIKKDGGSKEFRVRERNKEIERDMSGNLPFSTSSRHAKFSSSFLWHNIHHTNVLIYLLSILKFDFSALFFSLFSYLIWFHQTLYRSKRNFSIKLIKSYFRRYIFWWKIFCTVGYII